MLKSTGVGARKPHDRRQCKESSNKYSRLALLGNMLLGREEAMTAAESRRLPLGLWTTTKAQLGPQESGCSAKLGAVEGWTIVRHKTRQHHLHGSRQRDSATAMTATRQRNPPSGLRTATRAQPGPEEGRHGARYGAAERLAAMRHCIRHLNSSRRQGGAAALAGPKLRQALAKPPKYTKAQLGPEDGRQGPGRGAAKRPAAKRHRARRLDSSRQLVGTTML